MIYLSKIFNVNLFVIFGLGAVCYGLIEVITRGYTHPSMLLAGGICFISMWYIDKMKINFIIKCILSATVITTVELIFGCVFNIVLKYDVWDYSHEPFNLLGQICLKFFVIWCFLSAGGILLSRLIKNSLT